MELTFNHYLSAVRFCNLNKIHILRIRKVSQWLYVIHDIEYPVAFPEIHE